VLSGSASAISTEIASDWKIGCVGSSH